MDLIKITPNTERAKNILAMVSLLESRIKLQDPKTMSSLILADYYEKIISKCKNVLKNKI